MEVYAHIIDFFNLHGFITTRIYTDSEQCFHAAVPYLTSRKVQHICSTPYEHQSHIERSIRLRNARRNQWLTQMKKIPPAKLQAELHEAICTSINSVSNNKTLSSTPLMLVQGLRTVPFKSHWGQCGIFYDNRGNRRAEIGIVVGWHQNGAGQVQLRIYFPSRDKIGIRSNNFAPCDIPEEWGWSSNPTFKAHRFTCGLNPHSNNRIPIEPPVYIETPIQDNQQIQPDIVHSIFTDTNSDSEDEANPDSLPTDRAQAPTLTEEPNDLEIQIAHDIAEQWRKENGLPSQPPRSTLTQEERRQAIQFYEDVFEQSFPADDYIADKPTQIDSIPSFQVQQNKYHHVNSHLRTEKNHHVNKSTLFPTSKSSHLSTPIKSSQPKNMPDVTFTRASIPNSSMPDVTFARADPTPSTPTVNITRAPVTPVSSVTRAISGPYPTSNPTNNIINSSEYSPTNLPTISNEIAATIKSNPTKINIEEPEPSVPSTPTPVIRSIPTVEEPTRRSGREHKVPTKYGDFLLDKPSKNRLNSAYLHCYNMTMLKATDPKSRDSSMIKASKLAIDDEVINVVGTWKCCRFLHYVDIPYEHRDFIAHNFLFLKDKFDSSGKFDKVKGRWVYGKTNYPDVDSRSETVRQVTVNTILSEVASSDLLLSSFDVASAFLTPEKHPDSAKLFGTIGPELAAAVVRLFPEYKEFLSAKGSLYFELMRYLYGTEEASKMFQRDFKAKVFIANGFRTSTADPCLHLFFNDLGRLAVTLHVDDGLCATNSDKLESWFYKVSQGHYTLTIHRGPIINYCAQTFNRDRANGSILITMAGNVEKIISKYGSNVPIKNSPCSASITEDVGESPLLSEHGISHYRSLLMSMMYPIRHIYPDMHFAATYLAVFMSKPTEVHMSHLYHLLGYMKKRQHGGLLYGPSNLKGKLAIDWSFDASHGIHHDKKGHGAIFGYIQYEECRHLVYFRTYKINHVTLSSTESEMSVACEGAKIALWGRALCADLGYPPDRPTTFEQDNQSCITMNKQGGGAPKRTQHIAIRQEFVTEQINNGELQPVYVSGLIIGSDIGTKPKFGENLKQLRSIWGSFD